MSERRNSSRLRSGNDRKNSARLSSAGSVAITPPRSPAMNRVPSAYLVKEVEVPPSPSKWQRQHEQTNFRQLSFQRENKKTTTKASKEKAIKLARKIPTEMLAKEWMSNNQMTLDTRAYLVETILPTLILGVEKLLLEADNRGLTGKNEMDPNFNPVNYLAQYLMRNNPRYSNFSEASPYVKSLREVGEQLKAQIFQLEDNKLARIKNEARRKREEREKAAELKKAEKTRRQIALEMQFCDWTEKDEGRVEMALVQSSLKSFSDMTEYLPDDLQSIARYAQSLEATDDTGRTIVLRDFVEYISGFVEDYPNTLFDIFVAHLKRCATAYHSELEREQRKSTLSNLFMMCDHTGVGVLDRHRILSLFETFYDQQPEDYRRQMNLRNPRKWPVVEVDEADSDVSDDEDTSADAVTSHLVSTDESSTALEVSTTTDEPSKESLRPSSAEEKHEDESTEKDKAEAGEESAEDKPEAETGETADTKPSSDAQPAEGAPTDAPPTEEPAAEDAPAEAKPAEAKPAEATSAEVGESEKVTDSKPEQKEEAEANDEVAPLEAQPVKPEPLVSGTEPLLPADISQTDAAQPDVAQEEVAVNDQTAPQTEDGDKPVDDMPPTANQEDSSGPQAEPTPDTAELPAGNTEAAADNTEAAGEVTGGASEEQDDFTEAKTLADRIISASIERERADVMGAGLKREPTRAGAFSVSFAEGTIERERTMMTTRGTGSQSQMSAFDENTLNHSQFIQLTETFLGDNPALEIFQILSRYLRDGYIETEEEKMARLMRAHKEVQLMKQKARVDGLFDKWDNEGSGYLEIEEIETITHKYKDGLERQAINRAKLRCLQKVKEKTGHADTRLTKSEFRDLINNICDEIPGDNTFDFFVDFVESCVERTYAEKIRGEARKKWLMQIINSAETSAASLESAYRSVFQALYRDAETHGNGKVISANIAMHEKNTKDPKHGDHCLRYVAATSDDSPFLLNQSLYKDMRGISFAAVDTGKPLHVPRVNNHGNIQFWNPDREEEDRDGSFVVVPLKDKRKRVFGTLGIDTLRDPHSKSIFITHEIQFYQGVSKAFSIAYHKVDSKRKTLRITESAISWICRRSESVHEINVYLVEPDGKNEDYVLRRMMLAQKDRDVKTFEVPSRLERKDNLFRDYLFKCVDNSDTVTADAYGQRHFAFPLRGADGRAVAVIDISTGEIKAMPKHERKEILRMLKLVQKAQKEITKEATGGEKTMVLEAEKENEDVRVEIMFDRLMLMDLRKNVAKLDARAYAELKSYKKPPKVIHNILMSTLSLFYPEKAAAGELEEWGTCIMLINKELNDKIEGFDPTADGAENIPADSIGKPLEEIPHGVVAKHSSLPAEYLYNWIFVCLSLINHTKRMRLAENQQEKSKGMLPTGMTPDFSKMADQED